MRVRNHKLVLLALAAGAASSLLAGFAASQSDEERPGEFHLVRMAYSTSARANSRGYNTPMWAVDWPHAEINFVPALGRLTTVSVDSQERAPSEEFHIELNDDRIFQYPFMLLQQPAAGGWSPSEAEAERLREYLARGGFLMVDDFHGDREYAYFASVMQWVLPGRQIVEIPDDDPLMHIFFDLEDRLQIPGERHLGRRGGGFAQMQGPARWMGVYDDDNRLMVGINVNMDMGDAWEHADDPYYPAPMTGQAYRLGINYVIYAMTH